MSCVLLHGGRGGERSEACLLVLCFFVASYSIVAFCRCLALVGPLQPCGGLHFVAFDCTACCFLLSGSSLFLLDVSLQFVFVCVRGSLLHFVVFSFVFLCLASCFGHFCACCIPSCVYAIIAR